MRPDFSGYATKAGLKCTDGRVIMPDAFKKQDRMRVPLVWQHGHTDPENVLGHAILENRPDGVYAYGFFNNSPKAIHTKGLVEHGDINALSIWANQLIERGGRVIHGVIRELSLVLAGANPGAVIDNIAIQHSDGSDDTIIEDEAIIHTGLDLEILDYDDETDIDDELGHSTMDENATIEDVYNSMTEEQQTVLHYLVGEAVAEAEANNVQHAAISPDATIQDIYDSMTEEQQTVLHYLIGEALAEASNNAAHGATLDTEGNPMKHNVFENEGKKADAILSHDAVKGIVADAMKNGSLKDAVTEYALSHGIENIDLMFPDAKAVSDTPEWVSRRTEWVGNLLSSTRKSPFSRIKSLHADLTFEEARAKGYVKGTLKKEQYFGLARRITTPTTVYKKQKLDRDDVVDITDFDVVAWVKQDMRVMLDEEVARAILIGDGRDYASEDKINEDCIRPIAKDHELYTTTINVNVDDASSSMQEVIDAVITHRHFFRGTGMPNFYTTEYWIAKFLLLRDTTGRRIYKDLNELAMELRVAAIIPVEAMEDETDTIGVIVNPVDYYVGADKGGNVSLFDDFDIDYNQYKYLIETRMSGALVKYKSAMVVKKTAASNTLVIPNEPTWDENAGTVTIVNQTGVVYKNGAGVTINAAGSPYTVAPGATYVVNATPAAGYYFPTSEDDSWSYTNPA